MYCVRCGAELGDGAKFCDKCGLKVEDDQDLKTETQAPEAVDVYEASGVVTPAPSRQRSSLAEFMMSTRQVGHFAVPTFAALIAAVVALAGAAYAAVMLYRAVIEPAINQTQAREQPAEEQPAEPEAQPEEQQPEEQPAEPEPQPGVATGNPQSALQLAELLAMDPTGLSGYLEGQGLERVDVKGGERAAILGRGALVEENSSMDKYPSDYCYWRGTPQQFASLLSDSGANINNESYLDGNEVQLLIGDDLANFGNGGVALNEGLPSQSLLDSGHKFGCAYLTGLKTSWLTEEQGYALAKDCGLTNGANYNGYPTPYGSPCQAWYGTVDVQGVPSIWFVFQDRADGDPSYAQSALHIAVLSDESISKEFGGAIYLNGSKVALDSLNEDEKAQTISDWMASWYLEMG